MPPSLLVALERAIIGRTCEVERREFDWTFIPAQNAQTDCVIAAASWWRLISGGRIAHAVEDDGQ